MLSRRRLVLSGRVQGVFFRAACKTEADQLGLAGWARNLDDGRVEVVAEGDPAAIEALVRWCHHGPSHARVTAVTATTEAPEGSVGFVTR